MEISILTIGNELLNGSTLNTNASWIGRSLTKLGCQIEKQITVKDNKVDVENALDTLLINNPNYIILPVVLVLLVMILQEILYLIMLVAKRNLMKNIG